MHFGCLICLEPCSWRSIPTIKVVLDRRRDLKASKGSQDAQIKPHLPTSFYIFSHSQPSTTSQTSPKSSFQCLLSIRLDLLARQESYGWLMPGDLMPSTRRHNPRACPLRHRLHPILLQNEARCGIAPWEILSFVTIEINMGCKLMKIGQFQWRWKRLDHFEDPTQDASSRTPPPLSTAKRLWFRILA